MYAAGRYVFVRWMRRWQNVHRSRHQKDDPIFPRNACCIIDDYVLAVYHHVATAMARTCVAFSHAMPGTEVCTLCIL